MPGFKVNGATELNNESICEAAREPRHHHPFLPACNLLIPTLHA